MSKTDIIKPYNTFMIYKKDKTQFFCLTWYENLKF